MYLKIQAIMKVKLKIILTFVIGLILLSYNYKPSNSNSKNRVIVNMSTNYGKMTIELYNETPLHRDNFLNLARNNAYDSLLFHRVIQNFMIQGGDPDSKYAKPKDLLGEGDLEYDVDAEFRPNLFHKKGALSTAREETLGRVSSAMQFFIVQGKVFNDSLLDYDEGRINKMIARHHVINNDTLLFNAYKESYENDNMKRFKTLGDSIRSLSESFTDFERYEIPEAHRDIYKTIGGTPHLDQNYTVFGQVIEGLDVIDSIAKVKTDKNDRPLKNVIINSVVIQN